MTPEAVIFYVLAALTLGSAAVCVLARSLIYAAFALLGAFVGVAGLYFLLGADFLGATQLLIYVGGILVLLLFGVMLTHKLYDLDLQSGTTQLAPGSVASAAVFALLAWVALHAPFKLSGAREPGPTTAALGEQFLGRFLLPFEAASVLLLVAMMGAALIVRRRTDA
jgi:NADH-quinone oxidoreductase subunit J